MAARGRRAIANPNRVVQQAVDAAIREGGEIGLQVAAYVDGELVVDVWGGGLGKDPGQTGGRV